MYLTDWRGNDYTVGDHVLYPVSHGSNCSINEAVVLEFIPYEKEVYDYNTQTSSLETLYKIKVQKCREQGGYGRPGISPGVKPLTATAKPSTLTNIARITKVEKP